MIYKQTSIYKQGEYNFDFEMEDYNIVLIPKYENYISPHMKNLKSSSNGIVQLCGSIHVVQSFTPYYSSTDEGPGETSWPVLFYFDNVKFLKNYSNQTTVMYKITTLASSYPAVVQIVPQENRVYFQPYKQNQLDVEYYHLTGTFLS